MPVSPKVFEVTRFAVEDRRERLEGCGNICAELLWGVQQYAAWAGIEGLVSVSYTTMEPILRRAGYRFTRLGTVKPMDGSRVVALALDVLPATLETAGHRMNVAQAMTFPASASRVTPTLGNEFRIAA